MAQHRPSWPHSFLAIWFRYLLIVLCAIPFAVLILFLTRNGVQERSAFVISVALTLCAAYGIWRVAASRPVTVWTIGSHWFVSIKVTNQLHLLINYQNGTGLRRYINWVGEKAKREVSRPMPFARIQPTH
jgi:hypothetical protein